MPQTQLSVVSAENQPKNPRGEEDGILLVVKARIFGHKIRELIDNGAMRNFISPAAVTKCGFKVESHNTFLELGDGMRVLSKGLSVDVPIVTTGYSQKTELTVCSLLHDVDLVLGMTWLVEAEPLIRWSTDTVYMPDCISSLQRIMGDSLDKQVKVGTVKALSINEELESLGKPSNAASLKTLKSPTFWAVKAEKTQNFARSIYAQGGALVANIF